ncbi:MAG: cell division protein ZapA [Hungatella sp.]|nr:cell division protein ZapA [Hungatella sp.]
MNEKHYAEVLIDGKIYTLGGIEEAQYLQRVAGYINEKTSQMKRQEGFTKQSQEYQAVMIELNIADDYFKAVDRAAASEKRRDDMEKETYSLKHELVTTQMKLEDAKGQLKELQGKLKKAEDELLKVKALHTAASYAGNAANNRKP